MRLHAPVRTTLLAAIPLILSTAHAQLAGDGIAIPRTWNGDGGINEEGVPVVLRIQMRQAKLFAVEFC